MEPTTLTIEITDKFQLSRKKEITQAEYESDEAFIARAQKMLAELRDGAS